MLASPSHPSWPAPRPWHFVGFILDVTIGTGISPEREGEQGGVSGLTGGPKAILGPSMSALL